MFQENQFQATMSELIKNKFPESVKIGNNFASFTNSKEELEALRNGVGIRPVFDANIIQMTGKDVREFLHRISTNHVKELQPLSIINTLFLNEKGRFIDRTTLVSLDEEFLLIGNPDVDKKLFSWINKYIIMEDISTADVSAKYSLIEFIGRQVESYLTMLIGNELCSVLVNTVRKFYVDGFAFHIYLREEVYGNKVYGILIDNEKSESFIEYLFNNKSVFDAALVGGTAYDVFRIKNKIPAFPNEINDLTNPHEVNLLKEVSSTKGCYIGQEVIARLETYDKIKRKLVTVSLDEHIEFNNSLVIESKQSGEVGLLTSLSNSEIFENQLGLALVGKKSVEQKEELFAQVGERKVRLKIAE